MSFLHQRAAFRPLRRICCRHLTYYQVLGVPITATKDDIKSAYFEKAKKCHPDHHPNDKAAAAEFLKIQEARDTLMDSRERTIYNEQIRTTPSRANPNRHYRESRNNYTPPGNSTNQQSYQHSYQHQYKDKTHNHSRVNREFTNAEYFQYAVMGTFVLLSGNFIYNYTMYRKQQENEKRVKEMREENKEKRALSWMPFAADRDLRGTLAVPWTNKNIPGTDGRTTKKVYDAEKQKFIEVSDKQWAERNRVKDPEDDNKITDKMLRTMKTNMVKKKNEYLIAKTEFEKAAETQQLQIRAQTRKKEVLKGKDKNISSDHANNIVAAGSDDFLPEKNISADTVKSPSKVLVTDPS